jgi:hypothetical protein
MQRILSLPLSGGFVICCLLLSGCDGESRNSTEDGASPFQGKPVLSGEPNPVPAGNPDQPGGSTTITWNTGSEATGEIYVKVNRSPEVLMSSAPSGTVTIDWIQFDATYEFRLYAKKRSKLLAKLIVTRDN